MCKRARDKIDEHGPFNRRAFARTGAGARGTRTVRCNKEKYCEFPLCRDVHGVSKMPAAAKPDSEVQLPVAIFIDVRRR